MPIMHFASTSAAGVRIRCRERKLLVPLLASASPHWVKSAHQSDVNRTCGDLNSSATVQFLEKSLTQTQFVLAAMRRHGCCFAS